ncbi:MAG: hypothetical protein JWO31_4055 [Phycisphaerales bacterium]|nr:hypothetical protein [Phycisphaerales bacterium]
MANPAVAELSPARAGVASRPSHDDDLRLRVQHVRRGDAESGLPEFLRLVRADGPRFVDDVRAFLLGNHVFTPDSLSLYVLHELEGMAAERGAAAAIAVADVGDGWLAVEVADRTAADEPDGIAGAAGELVAELDRAFAAGWEVSARASDGRRQDVGSTRRGIARHPDPPVTRPPGPARVRFQVELLPLTR